MAERRLLMLVQRLPNIEEGVNAPDVTYIYMGGRVPWRIRRRVTHVIVHRSVRTIEAGAFEGCPFLSTVDFHEGVEFIEACAFAVCPQLQGVIRLYGVRQIGNFAFYGCSSISEIEFGDRLELIGFKSFQACSSIERIYIPSIQTIEGMAFYDCVSLLSINLPECLDNIGFAAFEGCISLTHVGIPLKYNILRYPNSFNGCNALTTINVVGNTQRVVSNLLKESWRSDMCAVIDRINQSLLEIDNDNRIIPHSRGIMKSVRISGWMRITFVWLESYKAMHKVIVNECLTIIDLALWASNLQSHPLQREEERTRGRRKRARRERKVTSKMNVIVDNVLPFLKLE